MTASGDEHQPAAEPSDGENEPSAGQVAKENSGCIGCLAILVIGAALVGFNAVSGDDDSGPDYGSSISATDACHQFVEERLKAPSTAEYSDEQASGGLSGPWVVTGSVDAENSFGASLRNRFTCRMTYQGDGVYEAVRITVE